MSWQSAETRGSCCNEARWILWCLRTYMSFAVLLHEHTRPDIDWQSFLIRQMQILIHFNWQVTIGSKTAGTVMSPEFFSRKKLCCQNSCCQHRLFLLTIFLLGNVPWNSLIQVQTVKESIRYLFLGLLYVGSPRMELPSYIYLPNRLQRSQDPYK